MQYTKNKLKLKQSKQNNMFVFILILLQNVLILQPKTNIMTKDDLI